MKAKAYVAGENGRAMFTVIPSTSRKYGYSINAPADVTWAINISDPHYVEGLNTALEAANNNF